MRKFFISDIHGNHYPMMRLLERVKFDPMIDVLIVGGDMIDRGPDSALVIKEIKQLTEQYPSVVATIGNHEEMAIWFFYYQKQNWLHFGGLEAIHSFENEFKDSDEIIEYINWMKKLPLVWEDEEHIFTHAGLNENYPISFQPRDSLWIEQLEFHSLRKDILTEYTNGRIVVHGHTPSRQVIFDGVRMSCDLGASVYNKKPALGLVDLTNMEYYKYFIESDTIKKLPVKMNSIFW